MSEFAHMRSLPLVSPINCLSVSPDGSFLATGCGGRVLIWTDPFGLAQSTPECASDLGSIHGTVVDICWVCSAAHRATLLFAGVNGQVYRLLLVTENTGKTLYLPTLVIETQQQPLDRLNFHTESGRLATIGARKVCVWDMSDIHNRGYEEKVLLHTIQDPLVNVAGGHLIGNGTTLVTTWREAGIIQLWSIGVGADGTTQSEINLSARIAYSNVSTDSQLLVTATVDGVIYIHRLADFSLVTKKHTSPILHAIHLSLCGNVLVSGSEYGDVYIWDWLSADTGPSQTLRHYTTFFRGWETRLIRTIMTFSGSQGDFIISANTDVANSMSINIWEKVRLHPSSLNSIYFWRGLLMSCMLAVAGMIYITGGSALERNGRSGHGEGRAM